MEESHQAYPLHALASKGTRCSLLRLSTRRPIASIEGIPIAMLRQIASANEFGSDTHATHKPTFAQALHQNSKDPYTVETDSRGAQRIPANH